jgi:glutamate formiminotransferase/formiminotetrahydrofolate cyclodeaminase
MTEASVRLIDMNTQTGDHPRIGSQDTIPVFPLKNITLDECKAFIEDLGIAIYEKLNLPVYFSAENARREERKSLDFIRKGMYEGLKEVAHTEERKPDIGEGKLHPTAGAVILSAGTNPLVAFNVILSSSDLDIAKKIAKAVRGPSGGFSTVRSVGLLFTERNQVCVSMNMFDYINTPLYRTYEFVKREAARYGVNVAGTEIVGTVRQEALVSAAEYFLQLERFDRNQIIDNHLFDLEEID